MFDYNTYGADLNLFYPFKDERFSIEARIGYVGYRLLEWLQATL